MGILPLNVFIHSGRGLQHNIFIIKNPGIAFETCQAKTGLKIFVDVIPKEGLVWLVSAWLYFDVTMTNIVRPVFVLHGSFVKATFNSTLSIDGASQRKTLTFFKVLNCGLRKTY